MTVPPMRIIGHRGTPSRSGHTENTLSAIRAALDGGADGVEVDVRATRDGTLVLAHDGDLDRVLGAGASGGPVVADTPFAALREVRLPHGDRIPTLVDALDLVSRRRGHVVTEVKPESGGPAAARTARLLASLLGERRRHRPGADQVTTSSFDLATAVSLARHGCASSALIVAPHVDPDQAARRALARGLTDLHITVDHVHRDPAVVERLHAHGLLVAVGIVDDPTEARRMTRLGVDLVCADRPERLARSRDGASRRHPAASPRAGRGIG